MSKRIKITSSQTDSEIHALREKLKRLEYKASDSRLRLESAQSWLDQPMEREASEEADQRQCFENAANTLSEIENEKEACLNQIIALKSALLDPPSKLLDDINGRAELHTLDAMDVESLANEAEEVLAEKGVTQKCRIGAEFEYRPAGKEASNSYARKASPRITTRVHLRRVTDGWRLVKATRDRSWVNQPSLWRLSVSPSAQANIVAKAMAGISVTENPRP